MNSLLAVLDYGLDGGVVWDIALKEIRVRHERVQKGFTGAEFGRGVTPNISTRGEFPRRVRINCMVQNAFVPRIKNRQR